MHYKVAFQTEQDAKYNAIKKLGQEMKKLKVNVNDFTSGCFYLTFIPRKSKIPL